jgi:transposase
MYIRLTQQKHAKTGKVYQAFRLMESYRTLNGKARNKLLLNLGVGFSIPQANWLELCARIEDICRKQDSLFGLDEPLEQEAQRIARILLGRQSQTVSTAQSDYHAVDVNSLEHDDIRFVGGEYVGLHAARQLGLEEILKDAGFNQKQTNIALGSIIGRLVQPGSEVATHRYLKDHSALDELLETDFSTLPVRALYTVSDLLNKAKVKIEAALYQNEKSLFSLNGTILLYDLTNTYFEGRSLSNPKGQYGRSKEKRKDCPLVTLGMALDSSGFARKTEILPGNVNEAGTLKNMLVSMGSDKTATIIMDAGIATEENISFLRAEGYTYIVVSRKRNLVMPDSGDKVLLKDSPGNKVEAVLVKDDATAEVILYCHSEAKAQKAEAFKTKAAARYETELQKCLLALTKKYGTKNYEKVIEKIGRLKERYRKAAQHYTVQVEREVKEGKPGKNACNITWTKEVVKKNPGVYCLRSNRTDLEAKPLWETYVMLTELEAAFCSLKSELGFRPVYHQKEERIDGHLFISVLAYHLLHTIRYQLKLKGINESWDKIRDILSTQCRISSSMNLEDGSVMHLRKTSKPDLNQIKIYEALGINSQPGKTLKTLSK